MQFPSSEMQLVRWAALGCIDAPTAATHPPSPLKRAQSHGRFIHMHDPVNSKGHPPTVHKCAKCTTHPPALCQARERTHNRVCNAHVWQGSNCAQVENPRPQGPARGLRTAANATTALKTPSGAENLQARAPHAVGHKPPRACRTATMTSQSAPAPTAPVLRRASGRKPLPRLANPTASSNMQGGSQRMQGTTRSNSTAPSPYWHHAASRRGYKCPSGRLWGPVPGPGQTNRTRQLAPNFCTKQ